MPGEDTPSRYDLRLFRAARLRADKMNEDKLFVAVHITRKHIGCAIVETCASDVATTALPNKKPVALLYGLLFPTRLTVGKEIYSHRSHQKVQELPWKSFRVSHRSAVSIVHVCRSTQTKVKMGFALEDRASTLMMCIVLPNNNIAGAFPQFLLAVVEPYRVKGFKVFLRSSEHNTILDEAEITEKR
ncbi:hypothetical protein CLF_107557 [Clonorchis sinensis]|uniref:Uncharacterized protein n=1 Tax=Clonorchis sinensis TaxID=79923 RepID=G7YQS8_CLOSI|nr:hypothetical protein CLF_107557 [Clonorchis sinensis]